MFDGEQPDEPLRRARGRHAASKPGVVPGAAWRARFAAAAAPVVASVEPRISAAGAWLFERRMHVLIVTATVATIAMIGGAVALISVTGDPRPAGEAATVIDAPRPTSTDPTAPSTFTPILPSPRPSHSAGPTSPAPPPAGEPAAPVTNPPAEPSADPEDTEPPPSETKPRATNRPDKPKDRDKP